MLTLIIPFHSDFNHVLETLTHYRGQWPRYKIQTILLCKNGSRLSDTEKSQIVIAAEQDKSVNIKLISTETAGIGAGYRLGIENTISPYLILSASDLPFGFTDVEEFLRQSDIDFAIGSKFHPQSKLDKYSKKRLVFSKAFYLLRRQLINKDTPKDSQGTLIIKTEIAKKILSKCYSNDYFFSFEIITLAQMSGIKIIELPVELITQPEVSSVRPYRDGKKMFQQLLKFKKRIKK